MSQTPKNAVEDATKAVSDVMAQWQKMGFGTLNWMDTGWAERMSDLGSEVLQFFSDRVEKDVELQHKLLHCRDIGDLHKIQAEFFQTAIDRYTEETGKLIDMGTKAWMPPAKG